MEQPRGKILGHQFKNTALANQALTHRSYLNEVRRGGLQDYQRLEFLGDAVLGLLLADLLFQRFPGLSEGDLSRMRATLVDQTRLADLASACGLADLILLGKGAEQEGGRTNPSILADVFEALVGAIFCDAGLIAVQQAVTPLYLPLLSELEQLQTLVADAKSKLQELLAARKQGAPQYTVTHQEGPDHDRLFAVTVTVDGQLLGCGYGRTKKAAQQAAAEAALQQMSPQV
jgi:ribonuclease-3